MAREKPSKIPAGAAPPRQTKRKAGDTRAPQAKTTKARRASTIMNTPMKRTTTGIATETTTSSRGTGAKTRKATPDTVHKSMPVTAVTPGREPTFDEIRQRAYEIYLARGGAPGNSTSDWLQAERELREELMARATTKRRN